MVLRVAVILVWRPKNHPEWNGRSPNDDVARSLAYDTTAAPFTAIHLASLLPHDWDITVVNEMVRDVGLEMNVDAVFMSTLNFCAPHARHLAREFRARGVKVIVGGLFPTLNPEYFAGLVDSVIAGEAEPVFPTLIPDLKTNRLQPMYTARGPADLSDLPVPRYDLVEKDFIVTLGYEATRGCPYTCSFCALTATRLPYRRRPVPPVIRDIQAIPSGWSWLQRRYLMLWDNNLGIDRAYLRELCEALVPLKYIWATETSIDTITPGSAKMMRRAGCRFVYTGLESLSEDSLLGTNKLHNKVSEYRRRLGYLHDNGILVMSIFLVDLDGDTPEYLRNLPDLAHDIGVDIPAFSMAAPIEGTPFHSELRDSGRLLPGNILGGLDGMHLVYEPEHMSAEEVELSLFECLRRANSPHRMMRRILRRVGRDFWTSLAVTTANLAFVPHHRALRLSGEKRVKNRGPGPGTDPDVWVASDPGHADPLVGNAAR